MDNVLFEVTLNGKHLCTAGVDSYGMLTLAVTALYSANPSAGEDERTPITSTVALCITGAENNHASTLKYLVWGEKTLKEGDEVTIRVLPDGEHDPPIATFADLESGCAWKGPAKFRTEQGDNAREDSEGEKSASENVRFEILFNGQQFCIAGRYGNGVMAMLLQSTTHDPRRVRKLLADKKPATDQLGLTVMGFDTGQPNPDPRVGDEIIVRILPPGECDPPVQPRSAGSPNWASRAFIHGDSDR